MGTNTTNYGFQKPTPGADEDTWGNDYSSGDPAVDPSPGLNGNWEKLDQIFKALEDRVTAAETALQVKVGDLYLSTDATDPATKLGYGTWAAHGAGRALVGVGDNGESTWAVDDTRGAETHQLDETELPGHSHGDGTLATSQHDESFSFNAVRKGNNASVITGGNNVSITSAGSNSESAADSVSRTRDTVSWDIDHSHDVTGSTGDTGGDAAHNNIQPSVAVYVWKRTA